MYILFAILFVIFLSYLFLIRCRGKHPQMEKLCGWSYAHRGLHGNGVPENSMMAFRLAKDAGYGIEFDVHLLRDGGLAVIHDASLKRTAGADILIEDLTEVQLTEYNLEGTSETIPTFSQVLELYAGAAPLIIELKVERGNASNLCEHVCNALDGYEGIYCIESFDPRCISWLKKNRPEIVRGQLAENFFANPKSKLPWYLKLVLSFHLLNFGTNPDFIAYKFQDRKNPGNFLCRKLWGAQGVTWTIKTKKDHDIAVAEGWIPIFENFIP